VWFQKQLKLSSALPISLIEVQIMLSRKQLRAIAAKVDATAFLNPADFLRAVFDGCKQAMTQYTYADFSEALGLGSNNANLVINGRRQLTPKTGAKVAEALELVREQRQYFLALVDYFRAKTQADKDSAYQKMLRAKSKALPNELSRNQLAFFNHWCNAAIVELLRLPEASDQPEWIIKSLQPKLSLPEVKASLQLLTELGYLVPDAALGRLVPSDSVYSTGNEVRGMAVYRFHHQMLGLASIALDEVDADEREISALTIAATPEMRQRLKQMIVQFRKQIIEMSDGIEQPSEILQINFQLFPIANSKGRKS
jgi:uncharacterized protein (TIGR02147 family)